MAEWIMLIMEVKKDVLQVEFMYLVFALTPGESYSRRLRSLLLCLCDVLPWWSLCTFYYLHARRELQ